MESFEKISRKYSDSIVLLHSLIASKSNLSTVEYKLLNILIERKSMSAGDIANITKLTTGAVTGLIDRLENRNLVKRIFCKGDRRKVLIEPIDDEINKLLMPYYILLQNQSELISKVFSEHEMAIIERYFEIVIENIAELLTKLNNIKNE